MASHCAFLGLKSGPTYTTMAFLYQYYYCLYLYYINVCLIEITYYYLMRVKKVFFILPFDITSRKLRVYFQTNSCVQRMQVM